MNPELICPPYILWTRRIRVGSDSSSPDPRPIVVRSQPSSPEQHLSSLDLSRTRLTATRCGLILYLSSGVAYSLSPVFFKLLYPSSHVATRRQALWTRRRDPSCARPAPVRASPISTRAFSHFPALCQSIPACTYHSNCLRDSPRGAKHFSSHVIHHH